MNKRSSKSRPAAWNSRCLVYGRYASRRFLSVIFSKEAREALREFNSSTVKSRGDVFDVFEEFILGALISDHRLRLLAPLLGTAVLQPEDHRRDIGRNVLDVRSDDS